MNRAVLDANVLVSAVIRPQGKPAQIVRQREDFVWLTAEAILAEVADVLPRKHIQKKYGVTAAQCRRFLAFVRAAATMVDVRSVVAVIRDDEEDNPILACGKDGQADYIVTGDGHLLALKEFEGILIVTPDDFLKVLRAEAKSGL